MHYYIITGASRSLGKALAEAILCQPNTHVLGVSRHATLEHERYQHQPLDLSDIVAVESNLHKVFPAYSDASGLTLINNAAVLGDIGYLGELKNEHFKFVFDVNAVVPAMFMNTFLSVYSESNAPRTILNISSGAAQRAIDGWSAYSASKAALEALTRTAQKEQDLRGSGVRVRSLSPGVLDTAMQEHIRSAEKQDFSEAGKFVGLHSEGQLADVGEVAEKIIAWLQRPIATEKEILLRLGDIV